MLAALLFEFNFAYNELDVLPFAYQTYNPQWIPADWYLNLPITYRYLFSYCIGFFIHHLGFVTTTVIGRIISYFLFAFVSIKFTEALQKQNFTAINLLPIVLFFALFKSGLGAGEWLLGGLDTKVFAYISILTSLYYLHQNKLGKTLFFTGLALSFHLLIGAFHTLAIGLLLLFQVLQQQHSFKALVYRIPFFFLGGPIGIYGIITQLATQAQSETNEGWLTYVTLRVPFHTLPSEFATEFWLKLALFALLNVLFLRVKSLKKIATYNLVFIGLALVGTIAFYLINLVEFMRYYWFRMADALLPLLTCIALVSWIVNQYEATLLKRGTKRIAIAFSVGISTAVLIPKIPEKAPEFIVNEDAEMSVWVQQNTPKNSVIITTPYYDYFYLNYQRPQFVSWKHAPQSNANMLEWHKRLKLLNKGYELTDLQSVINNYKQISTADIQAIQKEFLVDYILVQKRVQLDFPVAYQSSKYKLYQLKAQ